MASQNCAFAIVGTGPVAKQFCPGDEGMLAGNSSAWSDSHLSVSAPTRTVECLPFDPGAGYPSNELDVSAYHAQPPLKLDNEGTQRSMFGAFTIASSESAINSPYRRLCGLKVSYDETKLDVEGSRKVLPTQPKRDAKAYVPMQKCY
jgi:hypothetical protein